MKKINVIKLNKIAKEFIRTVNDKDAEFAFVLGFVAAYMNHKYIKKRIEIPE